MISSNANGVFSHYMPVLVLTCKKCGRISTFAADVIDQRWGEALSAQAALADPLESDL